MTKNGDLLSNMQYHYVLISKRIKMFVRNGFWKQQSPNLTSGLFTPQCKILNHCFMNAAPYPWSCTIYSRRCGDEITIRSGVFSVLYTWWCWWLQHVSLSRWSTSSLTQKTIVGGGDLYLLQGKCIMILKLKFISLIHSSVILLHWDITLMSVLRFLLARIFI